VTKTMTVRWTASDADGDPLRYTIQYSPDLGESWTTLVTDYFTTTYTVATGALAGSVQSSLIRVTANDGINTGIDASDAPFTLPKHAPQVVIETADGATFAPGAPIGLRGTANDAEDFHVDGSALRWTVERRGEVGTGESATVLDLPNGVYRVTLQATDSDGQTGSASIRIVVGSVKSIYLPLIVKDR